MAVTAQACVQGRGVKPGPPEKSLCLPPLQVLTLSCAQNFPVGKQHYQINDSSEKLKLGWETLDTWRWVKI